MDQWWERHSDVAMGEYRRSEVEDVTGCIPLLLDKCVVGGEINLSVMDLQDIADEAMTFVERVRHSTMEEPRTWNWYFSTYSTLRT